VKLSISLNHNGNAVTRYSGPIEIEILNENVLKHASVPPLNMTQGYISGELLQFISTIKAGEAEVFVDVPGFVSDTIKIDSLPLIAHEIILSSSEDFLYTNGDNDVFLTAEIYDENGNLTTNNLSALISFEATDLTSDMVSFPEANTALSLRGISSILVHGGDVSGEVNLIASSDNFRGVKSGTLSLDVIKHVPSKEVREFTPRSLFISLLGGDFGNLDTDWNLAESLLYGRKIDSTGEIDYGQVQSVSTITATPTAKKRLISVDAFGKVENYSENIDSIVVPATESFPYQKIIMSDLIQATELAEMFIIPKTDAELKLLSSDKEVVDYKAEGIYVQRVSDTDPDIVFVNRNKGMR